MATLARVLNRKALFNYVSQLLFAKSFWLLLPDSPSPPSSLAPPAGRACCVPFNLLFLLLPWPGTELRTTDPLGP